MTFPIRILLTTVALFAVAAGLPSTSYAQCVAPPSGLVGWWPGNGDAHDLVAGNDGQLVGNTTFAPGVVGQGFALDGFGDYVQIPDSAALKPAHMSVEAWVRFDSLTTPIVSQFGSIGLEYIIFKKNTRTFNFEAYALRKQRESGVDRFAFNIGDVTGNGTLAVALSSTPITVGQFYHVVGTYDGAQVRLYVNGVLEGQAATSVTVDYDIRPIFLGTSGETVFDGKLNGIIDEASIYNRALEASEVAGLYLAGGAGKCQSVTGLISNLLSFVQTLNLSKGLSNSLDAKLQNAIAALDAANTGDVVSACTRIQAFSNEVAGQTGVFLTTDQSRQLSLLAAQITSALSCR